MRDLVKITKSTRNTIRVKISELTWLPRNNLGFRAKSREESGNTETSGRDRKGGAVGGREGGKGDAAESAAPRIQLSGGIKLRSTAESSALARVARASRASTGECNFAVMPVPGQRGARRSGGGPHRRRVLSSRWFRRVYHGDAPWRPHRRGKLSYGGIESKALARARDGGGRHDAACPTWRGGGLRRREERRNVTSSRMFARCFAQGCYTVLPPYIPFRSRRARVSDL